MGQLRQAFTQSLRVVVLLACSNAFAAASPPSAANWHNPFSPPAHYKADIEDAEPGEFFISETSDIAHNWIGKRLVLHANAGRQTEASKVVQVRLFRLDSGNMPFNFADGDLSAGDCDIFLSVVMKVLVAQDDPTRLESLESFSNSFLLDDVRPGQATSLKDARWLAVFESASDAEPVFRILKSNVGAYFGHAWKFKLNANPPYTDSDLTKAKAGQLDTNKELHKRDKSVVCHITEPLRADDGSVILDGPMQLAEKECEGETGLIP